MQQKEIIALDLSKRLLTECLDPTISPVQNFELWSDSHTVMQWCSQESLELRVFEQNRMDLNLKNSREKSLRYVAFRMQLMSRESAQIVWRNPQVHTMRTRV